MTNNSDQSAERIKPIFAPIFILGCQSRAVPYASVTPREGILYGRRPRRRLLRRLITVIEIECSRPPPRTAWLHLATNTAHSRELTRSQTHLASVAHQSFGVRRVCTFSMKINPSPRPEVPFGVRRSGTNRCHLVCMRRKTSMLSRGNKACA